MHVADTDGDGQNEIIASGSIISGSFDMPADSWFELEHKANGSFDKTFASGFYPLNFKDLTVGDINGDGCTDIVLLYDRNILTYDGVSKSLLGTVSLPSATYGKLHCGNIDADLAAEILISSSAGIHVCNVSAIERVINVGTADSSVVTGQIVPDRNREIIESGSGVGRIYNGQTGALIGTYPDFGRVVTVADTDGNGLDELYGMWGPTLRAFDPSVSRTQRWQLQLATNEPVCVGNVMGDSLQELIALDGLDINLIHPRTGAIIGSLDPDNVHPMTKLIAGNVDPDGTLELLITSDGSGGSPLDIVDTGTGQVQWTDMPHGSPFGPTSMADVDLDGVLDLVYSPTTTGGEGGVWTVRDGQSKLIKAVSKTITPGGPSYCLRTANIDEDAQLEVLAGTRSTIYCFDSATTAVQWTRGINRTIRDFLVKDINGDGQLEVVSGQNDNFSTNVCILNAHTGAHVQTVFLPDVNPVVSVRVANVDLEPDLEIIVAISATRVIVFNAQTRAVEQSFNVPVTSLDVFDTDGDGRSELFIAEQGSITRRDHLGNVIEFIGQYAQPVIGLAVGDWGGDAYSLIFAAGPRLTMAYRDGIGGWTSQQSAESFTWDFHHTFEVGDCDDDGNLEVLFGTFYGQSLYEIVDPASRWFSRK